MFKLGDLSRTVTLDVVDNEVGNAESEITSIIADIVDYHLGEEFSKEVINDIRVELKAYFAEAYTSLLEFSEASK